MCMQMPVVAPRGRLLPPPPSSPPVLRIDVVLPYLREFTHCWPYSVQVFYDACLERKILVANRCLKNAERAMRLVRLERRKLKRYRDFSVWVKRKNRLCHLVKLHKAVRAALGAHMYDAPGTTNGNL